jgi:hypothetical protein
MKVRYRLEPPRFSVVAFSTVVVATGLAWLSSRDTAKIWLELPHQLKTTNIKTRTLARRDMLCSPWLD